MIAALRALWFASLYISATLVAASSVVDTPVAIQGSGTVPQELALLVQKQLSLPHYVEAGYSPLGRSPVVDAVLGDPFYLPNYGRIVSTILKENAAHTSLYDLNTAALVAGGIPATFNTAEFSLVTPQIVPESFLLYFGESKGKQVYSYWLTFLQIYVEAEKILASLSDKEKQWLLQNYDAFFFGKQDGEKDNDYAFFTSESAMPMKFFDLASRVDLAALADCSRKLSLIVDDLYQYTDELKTLFSPLSLKKMFIWEEQGKKFIISGLDHVEHTENADFFIDIGGNNTIHNNAGGTNGTKACALHIDLLGNNHYIGDNFVQGSGFLGVGILASFSGNNIYQANSYSQGCGFIGTGILMNLKGNNRFELNFGGQSCALFGSSLLWNKEGGNTYLAHEGMAQSASSTLGVAFLIDSQGNDSYTAGVAGKGGSRFGGIGQGGSTGVRYYPWINNPSFYGGLSFLYNGGGNNTFMTPWLGQGSAYFLSAGIAVIDGPNNRFNADYDAQGQGLHLSAGLLLQHGGYNHHKGGWGSIGAAGDLSVGMCINTGGNNIYEATEQSLGAARKPKALAVFIDTQGKNSYLFQKGSCGNVQRPESPLKWPRALFLQISAEGNQYSQNADEMKRGSDLRWGIESNGIAYGIGIDTAVKVNTIARQIFDTLPQSPRIPFPFDPVKSLSTNTAYRPLKRALNETEFQLLVQKVLTADYDQRRQLYESIDLLRFSQPTFTIDLSPLLANPATIPEDQLSYAILWALINKNVIHLTAVSNALAQGQIASEYATRIALFYIGKLSRQNIDSLLTKIMLNDTSEENRAIAANFLASRACNSSLRLLTAGLESNSDMVRYAIAKGLQGSALPHVLPLITPLLHDPSFYVRRAAAFTAISLHDKKAIPVLLETLQYDTLDTENNYGDNIYSALAEYVGVNFGVNKKAWIDWWENNKNSFEFPTKSPE